MKLPRPLLHAVRMADAVLFWPALTVVIWGELTSPEGQALLGLLWWINDKILHFIAYFILGAMAAAALKARRRVILAVLGLIAVGAVLELLQGYVGRDMSAYDELANIAGVVLGSSAARVIVQALRNRIAA